MFKPEKKYITIKEQENDGAVKRHKIWYPRCLNFYNYLPDEEITLEEFNLFALDRLQGIFFWFSNKIQCYITNYMLNMYTYSVEGNWGSKVTWQNWWTNNKLVEEVSKLHLPLHSNDSSKSYPVQDERRKDHLSHFILRLAHCRMYDLLLLLLLLF